MNVCSGCRVSPCRCIYVQCEMCYFYKKPVSTYKVECLYEKCKNISIICEFCKSMHLQDKKTPCDYHKQIETITGNSLKQTLEDEKYARQLSLEK